MFNLFWMEESTGDSLYMFKLYKCFDSNDNRNIYGMYNDNNYGGIFPPVALVFNYSPINGFMCKYAYHFNEWQKEEKIF